MTTRDDRDLANWIDEHGEGLTTWEADFLESTLRQLDEGKAMSKKQRGILDRMYEQRCAS